jgi:5-methylcytosine-specific restriction endonuclease McrA
MSYETKYPNWKELVIEASENSKSASDAAAILDIKYGTYKKYAIKYGCFITNQSGKGTTKPSGSKIPLEDILEGKHPQYQSNKLRIRLLDKGYFQYKCYSCSLTEWLNKPIPLELEHIDGNSSNNKLDNLMLLCPNCHTFTTTYRGKNKMQEGVETKRQSSRTDEDIVQTTNE